MNKQQKLIQLENIFIAYQIECPKNELEDFADLFDVRHFKKSEIIQEVNSTEEIFGYITSGSLDFILLLSKVKSLIRHLSVSIKFFQITTQFLLKNPPL